MGLARVVRCNWHRYGRSASTSDTPCFSSQPVSSRRNRLYSQRKRRYSKLFYGQVAGGVACLCEVSGDRKLLSFVLFSISILVDSKTRNFAGTGRRIVQPAEGAHLTALVRRMRPQAAEIIIGENRR